MEELVGKIIENYQIISILGKGGMGIVYEAIDSNLNRKVAIKVLNSSHISNKTNIIQRFKTEAQNHAQLQHQNIVTVYGFIEFENQFAIVMEYVEGESLEELINRNKQLHLSDVIYISRQLLEGINYAHAKGYIHRDIKPSNIIINSDGVVKIMDFGISKSLYEETSNTKTGARVGTVYYMSPEQIKGHNITFQTDIYSIGCTIYEMITGLPPFYSQNEFDVMDGHLNKSIIPINNFLPSLSSELNRILNRMLNKDIDNRHKSCNDVIGDLHNLDRYIKKSESDYFTNKRNKNILSRKKSIIGFSVLIIAFIVIVVFVFFQVKDFMKFKGYRVFDDDQNTTEILNPIDSSFSLSSKIDLGTNLSLNSGHIYGEKGAYIIVDSGIVVNFNSIENSWNHLNSDFQSSLKDIHLFENGKYFIVGENSKFISGSFKNKLEWHSIGDESDSYFDIELLNSKIGIIVGSKGIILRSTDVGKHWQKQNSGINRTLFDFVFINNTGGFAVGIEGTILHTKDLGKNWERIKVATNKYLKSISFFDKNIGLAVGGGGTILRTIDGGSNWTNLENNFNNALNKVRFVNSDLVLIVGNLGTILTSKDLGDTWKVVKSQYFNNWNDILVSPNGSIFLIGTNGTFVELIKGEV